MLYRRRQAQSVIPAPEPDSCEQEPSSIQSPAPVHLPVEEAVHKLTAAPASRIGLTGKGVLAPGNAADIVVFDPAAYRETGTLEDPNHLAQGVRHVLVNGAISIENGNFTPHRTGQVLRRAR